MFLDIGFWQEAVAAATGYATPALVRSATNSVSGLNSVTVSLPTAAVGNKLILCAAVWQGDNTSPNSTPSSVSAGSATGAWTEHAEGGFATTNNGNHGEQVSIWSADVAQAGAVTVTINFPGAWYAQVTVAEFSGLAAGAGAFDRSAARAGDTSTDTTPDAGPTAATTQTHELVVAALGIAGSASNAGIDAATAGYTNIAVGQDSVTTSAFSFDWKNVAATGTQSAAWGTLASNAGAWSAAIATFRAAAVAGGQAPTVRQSSTANLKDGGGPVALSLSGVQAGSILVLGVSLYEGTGDGLPDAVSSTPSLAWTNRSQCVDLNTDTQGMRSSIWTSAATTAGNHSVSVSVAGFSSASITLVEVSGATASAPLDVAANATGTSATTSSGSATATVSSGLAFACLVVNGSAPTIGTPAGWTQAGENENGAVGVSHSLVHRAVSAPGAVSADWTLGVSGQWGGCIAVLK